MLSELFENGDSFDERMCLNPCFNGMLSEEVEGRKYSAPELS